MKRRHVLIDGCNGVSGDMLVGALLGLGVKEDVIVEGLTLLKVDGFHIETEELDGNTVSYQVVIDSGVTPERVNYQRVCEIIDDSRLGDGIKALAKKIFGIAAKAGAAAHKVDIEAFYFHEAGAVDSFADIVGFCIGFCELNVENVYVMDLTDGCGPFVTRHGYELSVPVPAVREIMAEYDFEWHRSSVVGEMITPTGAAILAGIEAVPLGTASYRVIAEGYGLGKRAYNPNPVLTIRLIEEM